MGAESSQNQIIDLEEATENRTLKPWEIENRFLNDTDQGTVPLDDAFPIIQKILNTFKNHVNILEVGSGNGYNTKKIAELNNIASLKATDIYDYKKRYYEVSVESSDCAVKNYIGDIDILLIISPFILCGCWDQVLVEHIGFINIVGVDSAPTQGGLNLTYALPVIDPSVKSARGEILDTESNLTRIARDDLNRRSGKMLLAGKIQLVLYSRDIATKGLITDTNSIFERDPSDPILAWVVVVDGNSRNLIHKAEEFTDKPRPSTYMDQLLERAVESASVDETRVFNYDLISMAPGIDNTAPLIKLNDNSIEVKGVALFSKGKMAGTISAQQNGLLIAMMKTLKHKSYTYQASNAPGGPSGKKQSAAIQLSQSSKKIKISIKDNKPVVDIYLDLIGNIDEYKWDNLNDPKEIKKLDDHVQKQLQDDCQDLVVYMQSIESDPIGIGDMIRAQNNSYFKSVDWHDAYKGATITAHVKFNLLDYGDIQ